MNADGSLNVQGLADLQRALDTLPEKLQNNVMRGALRAGQRVIKDRAQQIAPIGVPSTESIRLYGAHEGSLRESLRINARISNDTIIATLKAGNKVAFYAHMVEGGAKAHWIRPQHGKSLFIAGLMRTAVFHPGARKNPFMKIALDSQAQAAVERVGEYIRGRLTKQGIEIPDSGDYAV